MAVSMKQIAKICGVSEGTVDRALNNRPGIKEETKQRILKVAHEMNYHPNHLARCLATGCTKTIGVVCFNICNSFFSSLIEAIEQAAKEKGYFITLILSENNVEHEIEGLKYLANRKADGLILFPVTGDENHIKMLKELDIPVVTIYNRLSDDFAHIDVDCRSIMDSAVAFIKNKGYDRIAYLDINMQKSIDKGINVYSFSERRKGYIEGIKYFGMEPKIFEDFHRDEIINYIRSNKNEKKAILCAYDTFAVKTLSMCRELGYKVPQDVGLMGFNNMQVLDDIYPRIYSVDCNIEEIGRTAFARLYNLMNGGDDVSDCIIDYKFSNGESL